MPFLLIRDYLYIIQYEFGGVTDPTLFFNIPINIQIRYHWFGVLFVILKPPPTDTGQESGFGFGHNTALVGWDLGAPWNAGSVHDGSKQKMGHRVYNAYFILEVKAMDSLDPSF